VGAQIEPLGMLLAAIAGALVAVVLMDGPLWLLAPGALGALLPVAFSRARTRSHE
jgi:hypothetical protein